jgi:hypothetical protein
MVTKIETACDGIVLYQLFVRTRDAPEDLPSACSFSLRSEFDSSFSHF